MPSGENSRHNASRKTLQLCEVWDLTTDTILPDAVKNCQQDRQRRQVMFGDCVLPPVCTRTRPVGNPGFGGEANDR